MKLFGGKQSGKRKKPAPKTPRKKERLLNFLTMLFNSSEWKKIRRGLVIVGCVVVLVLVGIIAYSIWEKPPEQVTDEPAAVMTPKPAVSDVPIVFPDETPPPSPEPTETPEPTPEPVVRREGSYTFLLMANDQLDTNTDTIIVGQIDTENGTLDLVSIPRDTLVNVSWGVKKLSTVLTSERNDIDQFLVHLEKLIGFRVDCYALVDIEAVEKLVDCIGGIYYNVPRDMDYDDPQQDLHIHIPQGYQLLFGEDVVKVLRFRLGNNNSGYVNGDLGRIETQHDLLTTLAAQMLKLGNIPNVDEAIEIFQTHVKTDLTANNIAFFLREFLKIKEENIRFHTLPGEGVGIRGGAYFQLDPEGTLEIINTCLNPYNADFALEDLEILRALGTEGAASTSGEIIPITSFYDFSSYVPSN
ncbi:MAG: LCP family protein [Clostridia bacterium]|nr:LCP family protein [Clostridia bacterium]